MRPDLTDRQHELRDLSLDLEEMEAWRTRGCPNDDEQFEWVMGVAEELVAFLRDEYTSDLRGEYEGLVNLALTVLVEADA
jgi:hypothetical protein